MTGAIELPEPGADLFAVLGLPRAVDLTRDVVEEAYMERARRWHPDRFSGADVATRRRVLEASAAVNEAHATLRDPARRAEYLCKLGGVDLDSSDPERGAPRPDPEFLADMIERREAVAAAAAAGPDALEELREGVEDELHGALAGALGALRAGDVRRAARALVVRRYLARLLDEIDEALAA